MKYPILNIKQSSKAFLLQLKINYRDVKVKRSFSIIGIILQNIITAASLEGLSREGIFSDNNEVQNILNLIGKSLSNIGRFKKIVTKRERKVFTNLTKLVDGGQILQA